MFKKWGVLLLLAFCLLKPSWARQSEQNLQALFQQANDCYWAARGYHIMGETFQQQGELDKALLRYKQALAQLNFLNDTLLRYQYLHRLGFFYKNKLRQPEQALATFNLLDSIALANGNTTYHGEAQIGLAYLQMDKGNYLSAVRRMIGVLANVENTQDPQTLATLLNSIGHAYMTVGMYEESIPFFVRSKNIYYALDSASSDLVVTNLNLAEAFLANQEIGKAICVLQQNEPLISNSSKVFQIGHTLMESNIQQAFKNYERALQLIEQAEKNCPPDNSFQKFRIAQAKADVLLGIGDTLLAHREIVQITENDSFMSWLSKRGKMELYKKLAITHEYIGDYKTANSYNATFQKAYEGIYNEETKRELFKQEAEERLRLHQKEALLRQQLLKSEATTIKQRVYWLTGLLIVSFSLLGIFFWQKRLVNRLNRKLTKKNALLKEQQEELATQAHQLEEANNQMQATNSNLEAEVQARTKTLQEQNKALEEYAFMNAHKLRGPVARLLGLAQLHQLGASEPQDLIDKMAKEAHDIDKVVWAIKDAIEKGETLTREDLENLSDSTS